MKQSTQSTTITINGRAYDAITGMPVISATQVTSRPADPPANPQPPKQPMPQEAPKQPLRRTFRDIGGPQPGTKLTQAAPTLHQKPQKSHTLHRAALQKPAVAAQATPQHVRSSAISKFGPAPQPQPVLADPPEESPPDLPEQPQVHPMVVNALGKNIAHANNHHAAEPTPQPQDAKAFKQQLIKERLAQVDDASQPAPKKGLFAKRPRLAAVLTSTLAILLLGGYLTYINLPNISMRIAATRAGVAATFPGYHPDGYNLSGPITYSPGEVTINFKSNSDERNGFSIVQRSSNWDSQAVLENYVNKQTESPTTQQEGGLTIYSFGSNSTKAAWVNGGIFYAIDGNAQLSNEQLQRLATSL